MQRNCGNFFYEYSGHETPSRDNDMLRTMLTRNSGSHLSKVFDLGGPADISFQGIVTWATNIESRTGYPNQACSVASK